MLCAAIYRLWAGAHFTYLEPSWLVVPLALLVLVIAHRPTVPWVAYAFWLAGAATLAWSLAPGNTVVYLLWELGFIAALVVGVRWPWIFWPLAAALLLYNAQAALLLNFFGWQQFLSGSVHYVAGAQALSLLPLALVAAVRSKPNWRSALWFLLAFVSLYLALISGARAVYLPLLLALAATAGRLLWSGVDWRRLTLIGVALFALVLVFDSVFPNQPMQTALGRKATVSAQAGAVSEQGGFSNRLRLWDQTVAMVRDRPQGTGVGSYHSVVHSYQKYPMTWSNSPHNYYLEVLATGGWLRMFLLAALLLPPLWRVWQGREWPWAVAVAGMWATLAFDVTSYYPGFMMFAFLLLGVLHAHDATNSPQTVVATRRVAASNVLGAVTVLVGSLLAGWWFLPCGGERCAVERYLGIDYKVLAALESAQPDERKEILRRAGLSNPSSSWVVRARQRYTDSPEERLELAREFARRFPLQHPENYLEWAEAALALGRPAEAAEAVEAGLRIFPADRYPYGEQRMTRDRYAAWISRATSLHEQARRELASDSSR